MKSLFGGILLAVGILVAGVSGLCSLVVFVAGLGESGGLVDSLPLILLFGGVPFLIGLGLFFAGRALLRSARREREVSAPPESGGGAES